MKKTISLIISLVLLLFPFGVLLNVKAESVTIVTEANSNKVIGIEGQGGATQGGYITVFGVNSTANNGVIVEADTFKAYKVLDVLYNSTTNEISYAFTTTFQTFLNSTNGTVNDYSNLTVNGYLALTSDVNCVQYDQNNQCVVYSDYTNTTSTLNALVSVYATYISGRKGTVNAISGTSLTNGDYNNDGSLDDAKTINGVEPGGYLVLADSTIEKDVSSYYNNASAVRSSVYGVMVGNVIFDLDNGGNLILNDADIYSNSGKETIRLNLVNMSFYELLDENIPQADKSAAYGIDLKVSAGKSITGFARVIRDDFPSNTPSNTKNNQTIATKLAQVTVTLDQGLYFDDGVFEDLGATISGNNVYFGQDIVATITNNNRTGTIYDAASDDAVVPISIDPQYFTAGVPKNVTVTGYRIKDPYVDIGANPTDNDIAKVLEEVSVTGTITMYGLTINNKNSSNGSINGGKFKVCRDAACTEVIMDNVTVVNDGTVSFVGVSGLDTVYIVQMKAPSGYRLADPISVNLANADLTDTDEFNNNYYITTVTNQAMVALPFTGGSGTAIYTFAGLIVIIGSALFMVIYKKKNKKVEVIEEL